MTPNTDDPTTSGGISSTPTPGWQSTEFWTTVATVGGVLLHAIPEQYAPIVGGLVGVYVAARTLLKAFHALGYAKAIPDLPALPAGTTVTNTSITQVPNS